MQKNIHMIAKDSTDGNSTDFLNNKDSDREYQNNVIKNNESYLGKDHESLEVSANQYIYICERQTVIQPRGFLVKQK
jgi:hypothetical protein